MITADTVKDVRVVGDVTTDNGNSGFLTLRFYHLGVDWGSAWNDGCATRQRLTKHNCESLGVGRDVVDAGWDSVETVSDPTHGRILCFWKSDGVNSVTTGWEYAYPRDTAGV